MPDSNNNDSNNGANTGTGATSAVSPEDDNLPLIPINSHDSAQAFVVMKPEIEAIPVARTTPINTDIGFAVQAAVDGRCH